MYGATTKMYPYLFGICTHDLSVRAIEERTAAVLAVFFQIKNETCACP